MKWNALLKYEVILRVCLVNCLSGRFGLCNLIKELYIMHKTSTFMEFKRGHGRPFYLQFIFRLILKLRSATYHFLRKTLTIVRRLDLWLLQSNATQNSQSEHICKKKKKKKNNNNNKQKRLKIIFRGALKIVHKIFFSKLSNIFLPF